MDWSLIALSGWFDPQWWLVVLMVALGLGLLIFIHELGHFLVAKACGVKCEKFYVGFDIPLKIPFTNIHLPSALWKKQWGETEYGIGILPLGGYVKMLGQDDNPYRQQEEIERAKSQSEVDDIAGAGTVRAQAEDADATGSSVSSAPEATPNAARWDPRSYLAQSVPKRMAIISAGVIMNVILCYVLAMLAFGRGVRHQAPIVGRVSPGAPAWQHNIPIGAVITRVGDRENPSYDRDVRRAFAMAQRGKSIDLDYTDPRSGQSRHVVIAPRHGEDNIGRIGIMPSESLQLSDRRPALEGTPAAAAGFQANDRIVAVKVAGSSDAPTQLTEFYQLHEFLVRYPDKPLEITVQREPQQGGSPTTETLTVQPMPMRRLGLVMKMGKITAVQPESPAALAGIQAEDQILAITDKATGRGVSPDPLTLPDELRKLAPGVVSITVRRGEQELTREAALRQPQWAEEPLGLDGSPMSAPALGVAYHVLNEVAAIIPGSPAAASGRLKPGDKLTALKFVQPDAEDLAKRSDQPAREIDIKLADKNLGAVLNWPEAILRVLPATLPGTKVQLTLEGQKEPIDLLPMEAQDWFYPWRGFRFQPVTYIERANSLPQLLTLAGRETWESLTLVVDFLHRIGDLWKHTGGPITIFVFAAETAKAGLTEYLLFLAMLSANLAVINILPIPVLDGGHLMFLTYEAIRRKPPSEKVVISLNFLGLAVILSIMVLVIWLDITRVVS